MTEPWLVCYSGSHLTGCSEMACFHTVSSCGYLVPLLAQAFLSSIYYRQTSIGLDVLQRHSRLRICRHYSPLAFLKPRSHSSDRISHKVLRGTKTTIQGVSKAHQRDFSLLCSQLDTENCSLERWYSSFCVCCCCETTVVPVVHLKCPSQSPAVWELGRVFAVNP